MSLAGSVTNDLNNSTTFTNARAAHYSAFSVTNAGVNSIHYATLLTNGQTQNVETPLGVCWTPAGNYAFSQLTTDGVTVADWCTTTSVCTVSGTTVTMKTLGTCTITPTAPAGGNYVATTGSPTNITINGATQLVFTATPVGGIHTNPLSPQPIATEEDGAGNAVAGDSTTHVTLSLYSGSGTVACTVNPVTLVNGVATFAGCTKSLAGTDILQAADGALVNHVGPSFTLT